MIFFHEGNGYKGSVKLSVAYGGSRMLCLSLCYLLYTMLFRFVLLFSTRCKDTDNSRIDKKLFVLSDAIQIRTYFPCDTIIITIVRFCVMISSVHSIKVVERQYSTGEEPLLVLCSDMCEYVCKYARTNGAAYKLVSELIGSRLAQSWGLVTPPTSFVNILSRHWHRAGQNGTLAFGSRRMEKVIDINQATIGRIVPSRRTLYDLLNIALFDFWVANEDRNANNANIMYDIEKNLLVSIDYGCIFNTAMYDYPMSQLTSTDTILASSLFSHIKKNYDVDVIADEITGQFRDNLARCKETSKTIVKEIPVQWNVPVDFVVSKLSQLFDRGWCESVVTNFNDCLIESINQ